MMLSYTYGMLYCLTFYDLTLMICCIGVLFIIIWCILLISIICGTSNNNLKAYVPESTCLRESLPWQGGKISGQSDLVPASEKGEVTVKVLDKRRCMRQRDKDIVPVGPHAGRPWALCDLRTFGLRKI